MRYTDRKSSDFGVILNGVIQSKIADYGEAHAAYMSARATLKNGEVVAFAAFNPAGVPSTLERASNVVFVPASILAN